MLNRQTKPYPAARLFLLPAPRGEVARQSRVGGVSSSFFPIANCPLSSSRHPSVSLRSTPPRGAQGGAIRFLAGAVLELNLGHFTDRGVFDLEVFRFLKVEHACDDDAGEAFDRGVHLADIAVVKPA